MQLTRAADYAVRVMIYLASQPEGAVISKTLLAKAAEAPESFLSKILQALARAGLVRALRGVEGGFALLPLGARASLLDVVESIDGPIALNLCLTSDGSCHRQAECAVHEVWRQAQSAMLSVLREAKIAEMVSPPAFHRSELNVIERDVIEGDKLEASKQSSQGAPPPKLKTKARPFTASAGAMRNTRTKKI
jgi:Rrf2 family protein